MDNVSKQGRYKWKAELLLLTMTVLITSLLILPIHFNTFKYPFLWQNTAFVFLALTFCRWIFFWKYTPYERTKWFIVALICIQPLLIFILVRMFGDFRVYLDETGLYRTLILHSMDSSMQWAKYIKMQMMVASVISIIAAGTLFLRLLYQLRVIFKTG